jgi:hypothetical protein
MSPRRRRRAKGGRGTATGSVPRRVQIPKPQAPEPQAAQAPQAAQPPQPPGQPQTRTQPPGQDAEPRADLPLAPLPRRLPSQSAGPGRAAFIAAQPDTETLERVRSALKRLP